MFIRCAVLSSLLAVLGHPVVAAAPRYAVTNLGTLPGWSLTSAAHAINETGGIVGAADNQAFLYRDGVMIDLGNLENRNNGIATPLDINDSFQVVGVSRAEPGIHHAFLWEDGVMTDLGDFGFGGDSQARGINNHGVVVGRARAADLEMHTFAYQGDGLIDTGTGGGRFANAMQVLDDGTTVGYSETSESLSKSIYAPDLEYHAFIFRDGTAVDLGTLGGTSIGESINIHGQVTGYYLHAEDNHARGFLYEDGQMIDLGSFNGRRSTHPNAINDDGIIVGGSWDDPNEPGAFLHIDGAFHDLTSLLVNDTDSQWSLEHAKDINNQGQIVGWGYFAGKQRAFLLNPVVAGDANFDGTVDAADLNELALNWRGTDAEGWGQGDFTEDGIVNAADLNELALNWQFGIDPVAAATHVVPEPTGIVLALMGLIFFLLSGFANETLNHISGESAAGR